LITRGFVQENNIVYRLIDLILPIANLSVLESKKSIHAFLLSHYLFSFLSIDLLGQRVLPLLLEIVTSDSLPDTTVIMKYLTRGRQEASRVMLLLLFCVILPFFSFDFQNY
jgi:hypothetical protein